MYKDTENYILRETEMHEIKKNTNLIFVRNDTLYYYRQIRRIVFTHEKLQEKNPTRCSSFAVENKKIE